MTALPRSYAHVRVASPVLFFLLALAACSVDSRQAEQVELGDSGGARVMMVALMSAIPPCNPSRVAQVYYVMSDASFYYCDGRALQVIDIVGEPGTDGTSWMVVLVDASLEECESGGTVLQVGPDYDRDEALDVSEVAGTQVICNGADGQDGTNGADGQDGTSCHVQDNGDGTKSIECDDGTAATVGDGQDGVDGQDGISCHVRDNGDGTKTLWCDDGTEVIVSDGEDAEAMPPACDTGSFDLNLSPLDGCEFRLFA